MPANPAEGVEVLLSVWDDGEVIALNGHVDLGTGIRTALAQIVAEELDVSMAQVQMVLGDTARAPNQGPTIASASIQIHAVPLRLAAAQARAFLVERAAQALGVAADALIVRDGVVQLRPSSAPGDSRLTVSYADLLRGERIELRLAGDAPLKPVDEYRIVGQSVPRVDIPAKVSGELVFVHDMRVPGMLHGRVVRPPYAGADHGDFIGNTLESVDDSSIAHVPGIRGIVVIRDFVGVVAEREEHAEQAAAQLRVRWKPWPGLPRAGRSRTKRCAPTPRRSAVWSTKATSMPPWRRPSSPCHGTTSGRTRCTRRSGPRARSPTGEARPRSRMH